VAAVENIDYTKMHFTVKNNTFNYISVESVYMELWILHRKQVVANEV